MKKPLFSHACCQTRPPAGSPRCVCLFHEREREAEEEREREAEEEREGEAEEEREGEAVWLYHYLLRHGMSRVRAAGRSA